MPFLNRDPMEDEPPSEPEDTSCHLGISRLCTNEGAYDWNGQHCCAHCLTSAQKAMAETFPISESDQVRR